MYEVFDYLENAPPESVGVLVGKKGNPSLHVKAKYTEDVRNYIVKPIWQGYGQPHVASKKKYNYVSFD